MQMIYYYYVGAHVEPSVECESSLLYSLFILDEQLLESFNVLGNELRYVVTLHLV